MVSANTSTNNSRPGFGQVAPPNSTGIKVIIVGAGFAGLSCAIEGRRKGHDVLLLEKFKELKILGDIIALEHNVGRIMERWGLHDKLWPICANAKKITIHNSLGQVLGIQPLQSPLFGAYTYAGHRGELHSKIFEHAQSIGVEIRLGQNVTEYWENETEAGVTSNGETILADIVVGADGVRSKARELILGHEDKPKSSGYAIYRAWFDGKAQGVDTDPLTEFICNNQDTLFGWIGRKMTCVMTHKDEADIEESWSFPGKMEDCLKVVEGWDPRCAALLSKAPSLVDWKLVYRDPLPTWISKGARLTIIGDAAHPFLPTSMQGASQAIEDGVTLAVALQLAGKQSVPLAVRVWEKIRYQRVHRAQVLGETNRNMWHKAKPDAKDDAVALPRPGWLLAHDAEKYTYNVYENTAKEINERGYQLPTLPLP